MIGTIDQFDDFDEDEILDDNVKLTFSEHDERIATQCIAIYGRIEIEEGQLKGYRDNHIGTGFLIDNQGLFVSVGHNFKKVNEAHYAFYNGKTYDINLLRMEYVNDSNTDKLKDLFIGELVNFKEYDIKSLRLFPFQNLPDYKDLRVCGFKGNPLRYPKLKKDIQVTENLCIDQYCVEVSLQSSAPTSTENHSIFRKIDIDTNRFKGLSGGPVYCNDKIIGILKGNVFLTSEYLISTLEEEFGHKLYTSDK